MFWTNQGCRMLGVLLTVCVIGGFTTAAVAAPTIVEPGWTLSQTWSMGNAGPVAFNPWDGLAYVGESTTAGGIWRLNADGTTTKIVGANYPSGLEFDPDNGNMFVSEINGGVIYRTEFGETTRSAWVVGFDGAEDDDPTGIAIVPSTYTGGVVPAGSALSGEFGFFADAIEVWQWSPDTPEGEIELINGWTNLHSVVDVAADDTRIIVSDNSSLFELTGSAGAHALSPIATAPGASGSGIAFDPQTGDLLVIGGGSAGYVRRVDPESGTVSTVLDYVNNPGAHDSLAISTDGRHLYVGAAGDGMVYQFTAPVPPTGDYNGDGIVDAADYTVWRDTLGQTVASPGDGADGDLSGTIDAGDYTYWKQRFGNLVSGTAAAAIVTPDIPEPSTVALALLGAMLLLGTTRRLATG